MVLAQSNMVLVDVLSWVRAFWAVFLVAVPVAVVLAVMSLRRAAAREGRRPAKLAMVAVVLVRLWVGLLIVLGFLTLIGGEDRALGDRLEFQEYGYHFPGDERWQEGPWLVLHLDTNVQVCPSLVRPIPADDPPIQAPRAACPAAKVLRETYGTVDIDSVRLVRQIQAPGVGVERRVDLLLWAGFASLILGAVALERLLRLAALRRPFARGSERWLHTLAASAALVAIIIPAITDRFIDGLVRRYFDADAVAALDDGLQISVGPVVVVFLLLVLAEIWRYGVRLQEDAEATV